MRLLLLYFFLTITAVTLKAQKIDSIYVNLYTDSLKKGTYNYINIDGLLHNGRYIPLDSTQILFWASGGTFLGNNLLIDPNYNKKYITIKVTLKSNKAMYKQFDVYIKQLPDGPLKTMEEINSSSKKGKNKQ
jgi:hypothetical protein